MDFTKFFKEAIGPSDLGERTYDLFLSGYTKASRVREVYDQINANRKIWVVAPEYKFTNLDLPAEEKFIDVERTESAFILRLFEGLSIDFSNVKICIDITGILRPHLLFMLAFFKNKGLKSFECVYSEPEHYSEAENTIFSMSAATENRAVHGFEGSHLLAEKKDMLVVSVGFEDDLIARIADHKPDSDKYFIFGLPSHRPDMYQQSLLRASNVRTQADDYRRRLFAPSNDPFVTASVLSDLLAPQLPDRNVYLSPVGTKAQALGFGLFYVWNCERMPVSIVYPFSDQYAQIDSTGMSRIWRFTIELPN